MHSEFASQLRNDKLQTNILTFAPEGDYYTGLLTNLPSGLPSKILEKIAQNKSSLNAHKTFRNVRDPWRFVSL